MFVVGGLVLLPADDVLFAAPVLTAVVGLGEEGAERGKWNKLRVKFTIVS